MRSASGAGVAGARQVAAGGLFIQNPDASGDYVFEARPQFANQGQWTSSDHLLNQIGMDLNATHKRLGDGFYEQRLVREQLSELTGHSSSGASDDSVYKELLTNGASAAHEFGLRPGIGLSADQVARLTSDIVWMVSENVQLPDGRVETVLVPKVYVAHAGKDAVKAGGALVTGDGVSINVTESIANLGGVIDGGSGRTVLVVGRDIVNQGGVIAGGDVALQAGRDIRNESLVVKESWSTSQNGGSFTSLSNEASIGVTGKLLIDAGRDLADLAGKITAGSDAVIQAGNAISFDTLKTGSSYQSQIGDMTQNDSSITNQLSRIDVGGDLKMTAGGDLNLTGTQVSLGTSGKGNALIAAGGAINIASVTDEVNTSQQNDPSSKMHDKQVHQNQTVVGAGVVAAGDLTVAAGVGGKADLTITAGVLAGGGNVVLSGTNDVKVLSTTENHLSDTAIHRESSSTFKKSSYTTTDYSAATLVVGSSISGDNVSIAAGNDIVIGASQVRAEDALVLGAGRDLVLTTAESTSSEHHTHQEKKSGFSLSADGFGYSKGENKQASNGDAVTQVGSYLSGGSVSTVSGRDTQIKGSTVVADDNIAINAGRDLSIVSAENRASEDSSSSSKKSGMIGTFFQPSYGTVKSVQDGTRDAVTQVGSQVASLGGDVTLKAGNKYTQTASDVLAKDGDIAIAAKDVVINSATNITNGTDHSSYSKTAIGGTVSVPVVDALKSVASMAEAAKDTGDTRMKALAALNSAAALKDVPMSVEGIQNAGIRVSISLGNTKSESTTVTSSSEAMGSSIRAGGNVTIVATGAGQGSNLTAIGSNIRAGEDVTLLADNKVNLEAAENTASQHSTNKSSGSSIGVGFGIGGTSNGFTIDLAVSQARGNADGADRTYTNTHVTGGNNVTVVSGGDTNLRGAVISGDKVVANVGGDLNIESLQDRSTFESKQKSTGLNASLCVPPFCYGASTVGGNFSKSNVNGDFLSVQEQSGIKAGDGGFQIVVGGNTDLKGGVLSSSQAAVEQGKNLLVTGSLTASDLQNRDEHSASGFALSGSVSGKIGDQSSMPRNLTTAQQEAASQVRKPGASGGFGSESGSQSSTTVSSISGGTVVIADEAKQLETGKSTEAILASLDRGVTSGSSDTTAGKLVKDWDKQQLQKEIDARIAITQKFSTVAPKEIADFAEAKQAELEAQGASPEEIEKWADGGVYRVALHAVSGSLTGGLGGAMGSGVVAGAAELLDNLQSNAAVALVEQGVSPEAANAFAQSLAQATAAGIGAVMGGDAGAGTALATDTNNRQFHRVEERLLTLQQLAKSKEEKQKLADAACALVRCSAGMGDGPAKDLALEQEKRGQVYIFEQSLLLKTGEFDYNLLDKTSDLVSSKLANATYGWSDIAFNGLDWAVSAAGGELDSAGRGIINLGYQVLTNGPNSIPQTPPDIPDDFDGPRPNGGAVAMVAMPLCVPPLCALAPIPVATPGSPGYLPSNAILSNNDNDEGAEASSNGGASPTTTEGGAPVGSPHEVLAKANNGRAPFSELNASIAELNGYQEALDEGQIGIVKPGKASAPEVDYATFDLDDGIVYIYDAKYRGPGGKYPTSIPPKKLESWTNGLKMEVSTWPDGQKKSLILDAIQNGKVLPRIFKWPK